ncbi:MAG: T9SS type A sorting domain-containing protein [Cruoricaptor ignavus]|nr:T9SS type A sorting domain-containing protein [Cruoricaptor ignavus]
MNRFLLFFTTMFSLLFQAQDITITKQAGWLETVYIEWTAAQNVDSYNVYYSGEGISNQLIDTQLIRSYGDYFRADILGLKAGEYTVKIVPVTNGNEGNATTSSPITVLPNDRNGFAHSNGRVPGAYNLDGTLKANAVVLYVTEENKNAVSMNIVGANSNPCIGLQSILDGLKKGRDTRPISIRLIGNITNPSYLYSGDIVIENNKNANSYITFEGVGSDAVANGWGLRIKNASNIQVRNIGFLLTDSSERDNIGLQQSNDYIWVHNNDLFYGLPGRASDQVKGDGALDVKRSTFVTVSYNHFWDTGKSNLLGLGENTTSGYFATYHHNWYDHSDSRHPRVRYYSAHVYNNYYDGVSKYGIGATMGSSIFVEGNYFRNTNYPMLISMQGSDTYGGTRGTFSSENGGMIKAFNNYMEGERRFLPYQISSNPIEFDAYIANYRTESIRNNITTKQGGNFYNNFDTEIQSYIGTLIVDSPEDARDKTKKYAGRIDGGDIKWSFDNEIDDTSSDINEGLMAILKNYKTSLVYVQGENPITENSQILNIPNNNDQTLAEGAAITNMIFTWGGTATDVTVTGLPANGITYTKDINNKTITISGTPTANVNFTITTIGNSGTPVSGEGTITISNNTEPLSTEIHNFTTSGLESSFYTFTRANIDSRTGNVNYDGETLTKRLKVESATVVSYTTLAESTLTLVLEPGFTGKIKVDGISYTASNGIVIIENLPAGNHSITKDSVAVLYYIRTDYATLSTNNPAIEQMKRNVFPNPANKELQIRTEENAMVEKVVIHNLSGQLVKTVIGKINHIDIEHLQSGIYIVSIISKQGTTHHKIIKK